ncbi:alanine--glyoxylate aminotransferase 2, mitochondrial [Paramormyrops kingsleyae]|uniref:Alanine--glyoxylate aminotransferase 2, mitochondrial n=1 Tax=Paramormyrops kingsleyae TaxID=1676925 RepID=A0A3B3RTK9_9TELE|nr:alanine--glyoxylate aminotransferase 2, mitochondrial [Paramormyrops kingsleyae]
MYGGFSKNIFRYLGGRNRPYGFSDFSAKFHRLCGAFCQRSTVKYPSLDLPTMPLCDFKPVQYKGMPKDRILEIRKQSYNPMTLKATYYKQPVYIHQGYMQWLWDTDGRRYLDFFAGVATVSVGHCHPKVTEAAEKQLRSLWHTTNIYMSSPPHEYVEKLAACFPDPLKVIYFTNSGSEANDLAMLMARLHTGNYDIISFRGAYHGGSPQTLGLTSYSAYKFPIANGFGCHNTMCPDVFKGPWGGKNCRDSPVQTVRDCNCAPGCCHANDMYIEELKEVLSSSVPCRIAAFFGEPLQGVGGAVQYPRNYLKEAYRLIRQSGGLCIADEVQTGFGRTGSDFWGFQGHGVIPDIVTMAKGIANGYPMGAVVTTKEIAESFAKGLHFNTFGGSPLACAIASSVLDTIKEDGTQQISATIGTYLLTELAKLRDKYEIIGDVRGKGLLIGVEMVKDKESRRPLPAETLSQIFEDIKDMGILVGRGGTFGQVFRIKPPMCITKEDADFFLAVFSHVIQKYAELTS